MTYTTRSGCPRVKLLNWNLEQEELKIMAKAFLYDAVEVEFWSSRKRGNSVSNSSTEEYAISSFSSWILVAKADYYHQNRGLVNAALLETKQVCL
jgi:hypothetical protein